jgi:ubiquinone/menaquinone biosynthesis C-methylase UbiE
MTPSPEQLKQREQESWRISAPVWQREDAWLTSSTRDVTEALITRAGIGPGQRVLDVACGTGEPALPIARIVGQTGEVVATDFSAPMMTFARAKAEREGLRNIQFREVDAETLTGVTGPFDAATIRWGIMFMPDPVACLRAVRGLLRKGGKVALTTWGPATENPFIALIMSVMRRHFDIPAPPPGTPGILSFAEEPRVREVLEASGYASVSVERVPFQMKYGSPQHYYEIQTGVAAPIAALLERQTEEKREAVRRDVLSEVQKFVTGQGVEFPAMSWLGSGIA